MNKKKNTAAIPSTETQMHGLPRIPNKKDIIYYPHCRQIDISGLDYYPNYVSQEEGKRIMEIIDSNPWIHEIRRRQQHYGFVYYHTRHNLPSIQPSEQVKVNDKRLPLESFNFLIERMIKDGIFPEEDPPTQCLVNEYLGNTRIASHVDNVNAFGDVVAGLSLISPCYMTMRLHADTSQETRFLMEPGSLYVLKDDARFKWQHGITQMKHFTIPNTDVVIHRDEQYRRVSLTFRKILVQGIKNGEDPTHEEELLWRRSD
jgi:alkylated DNA repair dioxygenase AlkB